MINYEPKMDAYLRSGCCGERVYAMADNGFDFERYCTVCMQKCNAFYGKEMVRFPTPTDHHKMDPCAVPTAPMRDCNSTDPLLLCKGMYCQRCAGIRKQMQKELAPPKDPRKRHLVRSKGVFLEQCICLLCGDGIDLDRDPTCSQAFKEQEDHRKNEFLAQECESRPAIIEISETRDASQVMDHGSYSLHSVLSLKEDSLTYIFVRNK